MRFKVQVQIQFWEEIKIQGGVKTTKKLLAFR